MTAEEITAMQRRIPPRPVTPRSEQEYRRVARWWELEAMRGHGSSADASRYGGNMRWAAELAREFGPGTFAELLERSGHKNPEARETRP